MKNFVKTHWLHWLGFVQKTTLISQDFTRKIPNFLLTLHKLLFRYLWLSNSELKFRRGTMDLKYSWWVTKCSWTCNCSSPHGSNCRLTGLRHLIDRSLDLSYSPVFAGNHLSFLQSGKMLDLLKKCFPINFYRFYQFNWSMTIVLRNPDLSNSI